MTVSRLIAWLHRGAGTSSTSTAAARAAMSITTVVAAAISTPFCSDPRRPRCQQLPQRGGTEEPILDSQGTAAAALASTSQGIQAWV